MHALTRATLLAPNGPAERGTPPTPVRTASRLWILAIVAGVCEALVTAYDLGVHGTGTRELAGMVALRLVVFLAAYVLVQLTRRGNPWARGCATLLLGTVAAIALPLSPLPELATGVATGGTYGGLPGVAAGVSQTSTVGLALGVTRVVELAAVAAAMVPLFMPRSNAYFRT